MKTRILSLLLVLVCLFFGKNAFAQFYDSHNFYLYIEVGKTVESSSTITYVHFNRDGRLYCGSINKENARRDYNEGILDEYAINRNHSFKYCSETSTVRYEVYKEARTETRPYTGAWYPGCPVMETYSLGGYWFRAFSMDRSEMIIWQTTRESNEAKNRKYYKRISPSDLKIKEVEYDFL